jgi:hypothetical protein
MIGFLKRLFSSPPPPDIDGPPSLLGKGSMSIDFKIAVLHVNYEAPEVGDVIVVCEEDSMGASIERERRARVTGYKRWPQPDGSAIVSVLLDDGTSEMISYMRRAVGYPGCWYCFN